MFSSKRKKYKQLEDHELLNTYRDSGASDVIGEFYRRYGHLVMGTAMKYLKNQFDAEDLVMNLFEKLPGKLQSHNIQHFKSWLYIVTKNECLMLLRKKGHVTAEITRELEASDELELTIKKEEQYNALEEAIEDLKEEQQSCIKLFYLESRSYQEISALLQLDLKKVKSAIQNGKRNLKLNLEGRNEFKTDF
ncbi:MAG: RNA polymerase subunit sigma-24 [Fluviicola sp. XM-24bin1]|nr:MAG: RNA polymerase subunit sigma-24 [Fluviicola sp. XM-24bin1]